MTAIRAPFCGTFRITPLGQPEYITSGNVMTPKCKTVGVSGNARQRRKQVRQWKAQGLRVTSGHLRWSQCVVEERTSLFAAK